MTRILKNHNLPIQIEGLPYIFAGGLLATASAIVWNSEKIQPSLSTPSWPFLVLTVLFTLFTAFSVWFYRNPDRKVGSDDPKLVCAPADGTVLHVKEVEGSQINQKRAKKISVFMSPVDVHVNRAPVTGVIEKIQYTKGKFFKADLDKASEENEHNWVVMKTPNGQKVAFVQIAGFIARRIVCYVKPGESLQKGERYGMIRFGSRMEIILPEDAEVLVRQGDKTKAGVTTLARLVEGKSKT